MTTINVTAGHIAKGKREDSENCAVALAVRDALPGFDGIAIGPDQISIRRTEDDDWTLIDPPRDVRDFIWDFDDGHTVEPFTFDLDYPAEATA